MNTHFNLEIISPATKELIDVEWVDVQGLNGSFMVGPDHSPLVSIVAKDSQLVYKVRNIQEPKEFYINSNGIFKVENNSAFLLLDS
jgi:F0F1-type ATP synthase epsilon subunit